MNFLLFIFLLTISFCVIETKKKSKQTSSFNQNDYKLFIIAGTQKSGTTFLSGLLAEHPSIAFSKKKELHFFDRNNNYEKGMKHYLSHFSPIKGTTTYLGESTPYYIASRDACERIANDFPGVKMIVMLREPISRAYSEYQMKVRRVEKQSQFYRLLEGNISLLRDCFRLQKENVDHLKSSDCLPDDIRDHVFFKKLLVAIKKSMAKNTTMEAIIDRCFPRNVNSSSLSYQIYSRPCSLLPSTIQSNCFSSNMSIHDGYIWIKVGANTTLRREYFNISNYRPYFEQVSYTWDPKACFRDHLQGHEKLKPLYSALVEEAIDFDKCAALDKTSSNLPILETLPNNEEEDVIFDESLDWTLRRLEDVDDAIDRCINVKGGITTQYFYRSLYAVQLYNCFLSIDPDQFLIIPSKLTKTDPAAALRKVLSFLDIPISEEWIRNVTVKPNEIISERYQEFAKTTSWQLNSEYEPLDPAYHKILSEFYGYYNELLFRLMGENYTSLW